MLDKRFKSVEIISTEEEAVKVSSAYITPVGGDKLKMIISDNEGNKRTLESGSPNLTGLVDVLSNTYNGNANKFLVVNELETGVIFAEVEIGKDGLSAYSLAVASGEFTGTLEEWLESLKGPKGDPGEPSVFQYNDIFDI